MVMTPEPSQVSETSPPPQGFNLTVVPVLIGFSLATIVLVATGPHPLPSASKVAICFLIVSLGLLLASFQLSIGRLRTYADEKTAGKNQRKHPWLDWLRTILSALGAACLFFALGALIYTVIDQWWLVPVLACAAAIPLPIRLWLEYKNKSGKANR